MNVFILTEGKRDIGFGHITRCISLSQAFEERGITPRFIIDGDETVEGLLKGQKYEIFNWLKEKKKTFNIIKKAHLVIIDSYLADYKFYKKVSEIIDVPVYIDDDKRLDFPKGTVVNGSIYAENMRYPKNWNMSYLLGVQYTPLRKEFWDVPEKRIKDSVKNIMITFGGDDKKNMTLKILKFLCDKYPRLVKNVIIGRAFQNPERISDLGDKKTNLIYNPDAKKMKRIMIDSDIAVSAGGQTLYELARVGVPSIGICVAQNQIKNIEGWQKIGFLEYISWYNEKNLLENLKKTITRLKNKDIRRNKSEIGKKSIDGKGSLRIGKVLLSDYFRRKLVIREATLNNALDIFNLSNDSIVRKNSFDLPKIEWRSHIKWLRGKLNSKNYAFFVVNILGKFVGQVRFIINPNKKEATVNISLVKTVRNLNLSSFILNESMKKLLKIHKNVNFIRAFIKKGNISSIKAFERANFKFLKNKIIRKNEAKIYIRNIKSEILKAKKRILIVAAHPDDEILGCGGTIARLVKKGYIAHTLILGEGITSRDVKRERGRREKDIQKLRKQIYRANAHIGVENVFIYDFPDNRFDSIPLLDIAKIIEEVKNSVKPEIIFTHYLNDLNIDHCVTYKAVIAASRPLRKETVKQIYSFEVLSATEWDYPSTFMPDVFFNITDTLEKKLKGMKEYKSELRALPHPRSLGGIRLNAAYWGMRLGKEYIEAFKNIRVIQ